MIPINWDARHREFVAAFDDPKCHPRVRETRTPFLVARLGFNTFAAWLRDDQNVDTGILDGIDAVETAALEALRGGTESYLMILLAIEECRVRYLDRMTLFARDYERWRVLHREAH